ncbi:YpmS family protein [Viridibacillus sp. NPDC093762]|uniref:YpmS family protein n=1 Tax=Viridibacillus sp. NPDC093762 TaxID=3390720 RepID=UPI003D08C6C2
MNKWKIAFFFLTALMLSVIIGLSVFITRPATDMPIPETTAMPEGSKLSVQTTPADFEAIANKYIQDAMKAKSIPVHMYINEEVTLVSELSVFGMELPITMKFDPTIDEDGNLILKQTNVEVGMLNIPPSTALKLLNDSVDLPSWMVIRPNKEEVYMGLTEIEVLSGSRMQAKEFNLKEGKIILEVTVPVQE